MLDEWDRERSASWYTIVCTFCEFGDDARCCWMVLKYACVDVNDNGLNCRVDVGDELDDAGPIDEAMFVGVSTPDST